MEPVPGLSRWKFRARRDEDGNVLERIFGACRERGEGHAGRNGTKAREDGIVAKEPPGAAVVPNFDRKTAPDFSDWRRPR